MDSISTCTDTHARQTANDALREASLAKQAIIAHERQCVERSRDIAATLDRVAHDIRNYISQAHDARARLHERVDQTQDKLAANQVMVSNGFSDLRAGMIRGLLATLLSLAGAFGGVLWYVLTNPR